MLSRQPGEQGDVETDPGGIAEGKREWAFGMCPCRSASTNEPL